MFVGTSCEKALRSFWKEVIPKGSLAATINDEIPAGQCLRMSALWCCKC